MLIVLSHFRIITFQQGSLDVVRFLDFIFFIPEKKINATSLN